MCTCCDVKLTSAPMVSPEGVPVHPHMLKSTEESIFFVFGRPYKVCCSMHHHTHGMRMWPEMQAHFFPKDAEKWRSIPFRFFTWRKTDRQKERKNIPLFTQEKTNKTKRSFFRRTLVLFAYFHQLMKIPADSKPNQASSKIKVVLEAFTKWADLADSLFYSCKQTKSRFVPISKSQKLSEWGQDPNPSPPPAPCPEFICISYCFVQLSFNWPKRMAFLLLALGC